MCCAGPSRPRAGRRALRLDLPGAQVEVLLRDYDLVLLPHVAVRLDRVRDQRHRTRPRRGLVSGRRTPSAPWHPHRSGRRA